MEKFNTKREAAQFWVSEFNAIPMGIIEKLLGVNADELEEVTPPSVGHDVYVYGRGDVCEVLARDGDMLTVRTNDGETIGVESCEVTPEFYDRLPMWGTMWSFADPVDNWWLEDKDGLQIMADCGFRIYRQEDYGYIFGIDGAGYDFYEAHWIPLYNARGLRWHKEEE